MENYRDFKYERAKERVKELKGFYSSLISYCIVIPILAYVNYQTTSFPWVLFPAIGWGIGLIAQWMNATGHHPILGKNWEERKIKEYMNSNEF
ncbi:2TM domain-containing protein [Flagellimonas algicola]|uniref:2TM domain-containing protein n=1 Tax=Flagellimonas algicola TaxID=2583815 RepID=A0ABY2WR45_9FLAO|nr:2TM domain-containing protein [Allomuricauda algicola]TMU56979.1 2TM domain-containing protein [Allomuricauda algicola]